MGTFKAHMGVTDGNGGPTQWVDALVDTGATYTVLPDSVLRACGVYPKEHLLFALADGREMLMPVSDAVLCIDDREIPSRVVFGEEGQFLLGATTLQIFGLIPDTTHHRLVPAPTLPL